MRHVGDKVKTGLTVLKRKTHSPQWQDTFVLYDCRIVVSFGSSRVLKLTTISFSLSHSGFVA